MPSIVDGITLPNNLYTDPRGRENYWRYRRPDRSFKTFVCTLEEAIKLAEEANANRDLLPTPVIGSSSLPLWVKKFILYRESLDPQLKGKQSWKNRCGYLRQFGKKFSEVSLHNLNLQLIRGWWDTLTPNAQRARKSELNKLVNYLMLESVTRLQSNPFSSADDKPRVMIKALEKRKRKRLTLQQYQAIHAAAKSSYPWLQIAMDLSLHTSMRRGDIAALRWDTNFTGQYLQKQISKSHEKLGDAGSNLRWDLAKNLELKAVIDRARELSMKHGRCPFVLSRHPIKKRLGKDKVHFSQVSRKMISDAFTELAKNCGFDNVTFHEIRSLSAFLYKKAGYSQTSIQELMAHTSEAMTAHYQSGHETVWHVVDLTLSNTSE